MLLLELSLLLKAEERVSLHVKFASSLGQLPRPQVAMNDGTRRRSDVLIRFVVENHVNKHDNKLLL